MIGLTGLGLSYVKPLENSYGRKARWNLDTWDKVSRNIYFKKSFMADFLNFVFLATAKYDNPYEYRPID